jgi:hypothetical protein
VVSRIGFLFMSGSSTMRSSCGLVVILSARGPTAHA